MNIGGSSPEADKLMASMKAQVADLEKTTKALENPDAELEASFVIVGEEDVRK